MTKAALLIELLTEELPPKALRQLGDSFATALVADLRAHAFIDAAAAHRTFASPRRLAVLVQDVSAQAPDREVLVKGPSLKVGLDAAGKPSPALLGFARKQGVDVEVLERLQDGKNEVFAYRKTERGSRLADVLQEIIAAALKRLPIPKMMRWGAGDAEFVRPVRGLVALHGETVVPTSLFGLQAGRRTCGHRFLASRPLDIASADTYESTLERDGKVIACFERRLALIRESLQEAAGEAVIAADEALYAEVTALVELPVVYEGRFDAAFLEVPQECLMLTMRQNQKYFPLIGKDGRLLNRFLLVSNMEAADPGEIVRGNERVLRARLADAQFFYDQDRKQPLATLVPKLADVVYHNKLGSQLQRVERIESLASAIAGQLDADQALATRAAHLAKADLLTGMVGEFPELQGIMGRYYARHDNEAEAVANAIEAHYRPRFAGDELPGDAIGDAVALGDKLDTLVGIWGIGLAPTGDKDPFALRRAALGVARILVEHALPLDVLELLELAERQFAPGVIAASTVADVHAFLLDRLRSYLRDRDFAADEIEAVIASSPSRLDTIVPRLAAVRAFRQLPEAESLAAANKRIHNILKKATDPHAAAPQPELLQEPAEQALHDTLQSLAPGIDAHMQARRYTEALSALAGARNAVDRFFDEVMVMTDDAAVRANRLALLGALEDLMNRVADISRLAA
ncbi:MAG TPA: glycine--tRNA ligase subunit beta [Burkholderiales bacterium]|nr:glycine--tRNA ligase subunit beta [Burkholderiales bacterium]